MTNKEAINRLKYIDWFHLREENDYSERDHFAFILAIKALEFIERNYPKSFNDFLRDEEDEINSK